MYKYRVNQHLIVLNFYSVFINKILVTEFINVKVSQSNRMFGTQHSETNRFQKTIECKPNEQSTKYSNWNMEIEV